MVSRDHQITLRIMVGIKGLFKVHFFCRILKRSCIRDEVIFSFYGMIRMTLYVWDIHRQHLRFSFLVERYTTFVNLTWEKILDDLSLFKIIQQSWPTRKKRVYADKKEAEAIKRQPRWITKCPSERNNFTKSTLHFNITAIYVLIIRINLQLIPCPVQIISTTGQRGKVVEKSKAKRRPRIKQFAEWVSSPV